MSERAIGPPSTWDALSDADRPRVIHYHGISGFCSPAQAPGAPPAVFQAMRCRSSQARARSGTRAKPSTTSQRELADRCPRGLGGGPWRFQVFWAGAPRLVPAQLVTDRLRLPAGWPIAKAPRGGSGQRGVAARESRRKPRQITANRGMSSELRPAMLLRLLLGIRDKEMTPGL